MDRNEVIQKVYSKVDELPTLPIVLPKILSLMENEATSGMDIADAIASDPIITSKLLKVANSAYYGFQQEISSLKKCIPLLGFNMVRSLALSIGVIKSFPTANKTSSFSRENLWIHSVAVGTLMQEMGKKYRKGKDNEYLFVLGLLHDIGKVVLDQFFHELFEQILEKSLHMNRIDLYAAERQIIGIDHGEVGAILLRRWKFPEKIASTIDVHHKNEVPEEGNPYDVAILRVADNLAMEFACEGGHYEAPELLDKDIMTLEINGDGLNDLKAFLESARDGIMAFFSAIN